MFEKGRILLSRKFLYVSGLYTFTFKAIPQWVINKYFIYTPHKLFYLNYLINYLSMISYIDFLKVNPKLQAILKKEFNVESLIQINADSHNESWRVFPYITIAFELNFIINASYRGNQWRICERIRDEKSRWIGRGEWAPPRAMCHTISDRHARFPAIWRAICNNIKINSAAFVKTLERGGRGWGADVSRRVRRRSTLRCAEEDNRLAKRKRKRETERDGVEKRKGESGEREDGTAREPTRNNLR